MFGWGDWEVFSSNGRPGGQEQSEHGQGGCRRQQVTHLPRAGDLHWGIARDKIHPLIQQAFIEFLYKLEICGV